MYNPSSATSGVVEQVDIDVIYGPNKVGKSTLASQYPNPFFADIEKGSLHLPVTRETNIPDLKTYREILKWMIEGKHDFKTFVTDSIEALEGLILDHVLLEAKVNSINKVGKYGEGYTRSREIMRDIMGDLRTLAEVKGVRVVLLGHSQQKTKTDAVTNSQYDAFFLRTNDKMASIIKDLANNIFFLTYQIYTSTENGVTKAYSTDDRLLRCTWSAFADAGNRRNLPPEVILKKDTAYQDLQAAILKAKTQGKSADQLKEEISLLIPKMKDQKVREVAMQKLAEAKTVDQLTNVLKRVTNETQPAA